MVPHRQVRAVYDDATITVYQAFRAEIADAAVAAGRFVPPFKPDRMTWVKPSFLWMMYRSGWGTKPDQERVLAVTMIRAGFDEALSLAALASFDRNVYPDRQIWQQRVKTSPVRVQWDPERSPTGAPLDYRSLQVGLSGWAAQQYVAEWTVTITDISAQVADLHRQVRADPHDLAGLPVEHPYPLPATAAAAVGAS